MKYPVVLMIFITILASCKQKHENYIILEDINKNAMVGLDSINQEMVFMRVNKDGEVHGIVKRFDSNLKLKTITFYHHDKPIDSRDIIYNHYITNSYENFRNIDTSCFVAPQKNYYNMSGDTLEVEYLFEDYPICKIKYCVGKGKILDHSSDIENNTLYFKTVVENKKNSVYFEYYSDSLPFSHKWFVY